MAFAEILTAGALLTTYPYESSESKTVVAYENVVQDTSELAVLPKVLKIADFEIAWIDQ